MRIVFVRPDHFYDSYRIYWRLVDLSGFETMWLRDIDLSADAFYIVSPHNGQFREAIQRRTAAAGGAKRSKVAVWNLERPDAAPGVLEATPTTAADEVSRLLDGADYLWAFDPHYASFDDRMIRVTLGSHPGLRDEPSTPPSYYDLCHFSYVNVRRHAVLSALGRRHTIGPETWGAERAAILCGSRSMVYVHQTPFPIGSPLRFALAAAYSLPLFSEEMANPYPMEPGLDFVQVPYVSMVEAFSEWLSMTDPKMGSRLHKRLCTDHSFRKGVEDGVRRSLRR